MISKLLILKTYHKEEKQFERIAGVWREDYFSFLHPNGVEIIFTNTQVISFGPLPWETNMCRG